jgi:predicted nuclease of predicted toxin-antitoxin system
VRFLHERGHDAAYVPDLLPPRTPDELVAAMARATGRCLITADFDFSDIRDFPPREHPGIVVLTLPPGRRTRYALELLTELLARIDELLPLERKLLIVSSGQIRIRE